MWLSGLGLDSEAPKQDDNGLRQKPLSSHTKETQGSSLLQGSPGLEVSAGFWKSGNPFVCHSRTLTTSPSRGSHWVVDSIPMHAGSRAFRFPP